MTFTSDRSGTMQIYLMDLASHAVTPVTDQLEGADQSSFSHDGTLITFHSGPSVYVVHPDGTGLKKVATGLDDFNAYFFPHFTLGDTGLVFDRNNEIDTVALDGAGMRMVIQNTTTTIKSPSVSPATGEIVYNAYCSGTSIWTAPFSTKTNACEGTRLTPAGEPTSQRAAWGPGDVFAYERVDTTSNVGQIALISRTRGSLPCILAPGTADNRNPAWSP
jgi:Tol biopolymer transport system component